MCGIVGGWTDEEIGDQIIDDSMNAIAHRGPDEAGRLRDGAVFLGMRRLSIIDLADGQQPIYNEDRSVAVIFNGEIYNYRELTTELQRRGHQFYTQSDTEVLVHLYEEEGANLCRRLRGMYAFALWDRNRQRLLLGRDRFGKKPLYYTRTTSDGLVFASELKALQPLSAATGKEWVLRKQSIYDYLSLAFVPQPNTVFEGVHCIPPASVAVFDGDSIQIERYWSLSYMPKRSIPYSEALERVRALVSDAVRLRLRSDVPIGVFLSGGVDSSVIAFEAAKELGPSLQTFTIALDDQSFDESPVAMRTAEALGVQNQVLHLERSSFEPLSEVVRRYDQPFADPSAIPSLAVARLAREHVKVVLNGDGGDEVFAGYRRYLAAHLMGYSFELPAFLGGFLPALATRLSASRRSVLGFSARLARGAVLSPGARYLAWTSDTLREADKKQVWKGNGMRSTEDWLESHVQDRLGGLDTQSSMDTGIILLSDLLVKMDIATMAESLEARSPLLDHLLAEFVVALPPNYRLRRGRLKSLLRDAYHRKLTDEVITGPKRGFEIPLESWLQTEWRELLMDTVGSPTAFVREYLQDQFIDGLLHNRLMEDRNRAEMVYTVLVLELWLRQFRAADVRKPQQTLHTF